MNNKSTGWAIVLIVIILALVGGIYFWQKSTIPQQITTIKQTENEVPSTPSNSLVNTTQIEKKEIVTKTLEDCPTKPYVKSHEGLSVNDQPGVKEYIVPINCSESFIFKRQGSGENANEWSGVFGVYFQANGLEKYLFEHQGLLMNIAGGTLWDVIEQGDVIHISLEFVDLGGMRSWDYYISNQNKELLVGFTDSLNILVGSSKKYELTLDTEPIWCQEESATRITKSIIYNSKQYKLTNEIQEPCEGNVNDIFPPPRITVSNIDITGNKVTLNVSQNEEIVFDYGKGEFIELNSMY